jgi:4-amino-4-deoxy-L-arabinose transferase-like glycosyltransferase
MVCWFFGERQLPKLAMNQQYKPSSSHKFFRLPFGEAGALSIILLIALALRLWGMGFGLPYEYHVDEVQYVRQAASMGARGLEPTWWNNPPFFKYILLGEYGALFVVGKVLGWYTAAADFGAQHTLDPTGLYLLGRMTSALFGMLTVFVVYLLGKTAYNRRVGLLAAWFLAVSFIHVRDSHFAVNDVALTFFVTVTLLAAVQIAQTAEKKWYMLGGAALGLGFATKYSAVFALVPLLVAHFVSPGVRVKGVTRWQVRRLAIAPAVAGLAAVIGSPYFVLTPGKVVRDVYAALYLAGQHGFDGWQIDPAGGYVFYLKSLSWGLGWGLLFLVLGGLVVAALRHLSKDLVLLSLPIATYAVMGRQQMYFARFMLPIVPAFLILGASLLEKVISSPARSRKGALLVLAAGVLLVTAQPLADGLRFDYLLTRQDTRTQAKQWIETHIPAGAKIAVDWPTHGPPLSTLEKAMPDSMRTYDVTIVGGTGLSDHPLQWYREQGFDYLIASSFIYRIPLLDKTRDAERRAFYASLDRELELVQAFRPYDGDEEPPFIFDEIYGPAISLWQRQRPGPTIKIYHVTP